MSESDWVQAWWGLSDRVAAFSEFQKAAQLWPDFDSSRHARFAAWPHAVDLGQRMGQAVPATAVEVESVLAAPDTPAEELYVAGPCICWA